MSIDASFLKMYHDALKKAVMTSDMSDKYEALCDKYDDLREEINVRLERKDSVCSDAERLFDKESGRLKKEAELVIGDDNALRGMLSEFEKLLMNKRSFAEFGWGDRLISTIDPVLAIAEYSDMEKKIIAELGLDEGQRVIYGIKKKIVEFEKELGISFFGESVLKMRDLFRIKQLFSNSSEINVNEKDNLETQRLVLTNSAGESIRCEKTAEITHNGSLYIELELLEDIRVCVFNYYLFSNSDNRQTLRLVEDKQLEKILDEKRDKL